MCIKLAPFLPIFSFPVEIWPSLKKTNVFKIVYSKHLFFLHYMPNYEPER